MKNPEKDSQNSILAAVFVSLTKAMPTWVTPNAITSFRLVLIAPIIACALTQRWYLFIFLYLLTLISDALDGTLARFRNSQTSFGSKYDPVVDKILHVLLFVLVFFDFPIGIGLIILLDIIILVGGYIVISHHKFVRRVLPINGANIFGKYKVLTQGITIFFLYFVKIFSSFSEYKYIPRFFAIVTIFLSIMSIYQYAIDLINAKNTAK